MTRRNGNPSFAASFASSPGPAPPAGRAFFADRITGDDRIEESDRIVYPCFFVMAWTAMMRSSSI